MYRFLLPLSLTAVVLPVAAQHVAVPGHSAVLPAAAGQPTRLIEGGGPLTLSTALRMAMDANSELSAARYELQAVEATVLQAGVVSNPALECRWKNATARRTWRKAGNRGSIAALRAPLKTPARCSLKRLIEPYGKS